jgi:hypothetical protein
MGMTFKGLKTTFSKAQKRNLNRNKMQKNLFKKLIQFKYTISTAICEDVSIKLLRNSDS